MAEFGYGRGGIDPNSVGQGTRSVGSLAQYMADSGKGGRIMSHAMGLSPDQYGQAQEMSGGLQGNPNYYAQRDFQQGREAAGGAYSSGGAASTANYYTQGNKGRYDAPAGSPAASTGPTNIARSPTIPGTTTNTGGGRGAADIYRNAQTTKPPGTTTPGTTTPNSNNPYEGMTTLYRDNTGMLHDPGDNPLTQTLNTLPRDGGMPKPNGGTGFYNNRPDMDFWRRRRAIATPQPQGGNVNVGQPTVTPPAYTAPSPTTNFPRMTRPEGPNMPPPNTYTPPPPAGVPGPNRFDTNMKYYFPY